ncbi:Putative surface layer protein (modular protein) [uncultured Eubacteriales bacterium]|uniref:Putative surface layer protein (Modular protein) n=1 Tax=uncultured Eubacteriales bacterium TaxID=172733 RepID=A0A212JLS7_9FIRM|nr:Putative surface layer protein (modular protein) [uncultured Eubacteriales bacterium]
MKKRLLSILLSVCMVLTLLPMGVLATATTVSKGDFMVTSGEDTTTYENGVLTFSTEGTYTVAMASGKSSTSNVIKVTAEGVTLNLNGVVINAPNGWTNVPDGATALTVTSGTVTLNVIADSSLTGGMGNPSLIEVGKSGAGISGNITVMGTATLTSTGGVGGSSDGGTGGAGGAGVSGNVTITEDATLTATGGKGGSTERGSCGDGGVGMSGDITVMGTATFVCTGGKGGSSSSSGVGGDGGNGVSGSVTVKEAARLTATGGGVGTGGIVDGMLVGVGIKGTITVGNGYTVVAGADANHAAALIVNKTSKQYVAITPPAPQAKWGVANGSAAPSSWAGSGTLDDAMTYANANSGAYIQLQGDADTTATLIFDDETTTILDLNGKTIDAKNGTFSVLTVNGNLTLCDSSATAVADQGKITGGTGYDGYGGGVYIESTGAFTMTGGNITGNTSGTSGGGVYGDSTGNVMTMTGGSITGNHTQYNGGGVFIQTGGFTVGGTAKITGNTSGTTPDILANNVYLLGGIPTPTDQQILAISTATPLTTGASIGVRTALVPSASSPLAFTGENSADYSGYFTSDNSSYVVQNSGADSAQIVQLAVPVTQAPTVTAVSPTSGSTTGGTSVTITGTNLSGATAVKFGSTSATSFTVTSATSITATAPVGTGIVDITVTTAGGTSTTSAASKFTYALPTAAQYAAASPAAASGTDYDLDTTNKTLTIKTAKGAAWWSANGDTYTDDMYTVLLANDIDVSAFLWSPVGSAPGSAFAGSFDGQGHTITGLTVKIEAGDETVFAGLFGEFCGSVKNLGLVNVSIVASNTSTNNKLVYAGALAGDVFRGDVFNGTISNCFVRGGSVSAASSSGSYAGGLVGYAGQKIAIRNCYSTANVSATGTGGFAGGVIGTLNSGTVDQCYYVDTATITGTNSNLGTSLPDTQMKAASGGENALIDRMNTWVEQQDSIDYYTWQADSGTTNGGYPVFDAKRTAPKAQWGVAGSDGSTPISWTTGTLADAVEYANDLTSGTAYIQLLENVNTTAALEFENGKTTVLDLNGKTINGSSIPTSSLDNNVLTVNGHLTLCDTSTATVANQGKITGGHGTGDGTGGGVYVDSSGTFIMTGGNITGNTAMNGGGVGNRGTFTMSGGSIAGNSCISGSGDVSIGGGVANSGEFNMSGGSITGNTVVAGGAGGGVLTNEGMTLSGNVNISGNTVGEASDNVALMPYGGHPSNIYITGALTNSTAIGVSIVEMTEEDDDSFVFTPKSGIFTAGDAVTNSDYISKFVSDNSEFAVIVNDSQLKLAAAQAIAKTAATNGSFTVKVNGNEVPSAIQGQTVTVTPAANSGYELDTISVCKTEDSDTAVTVTNGSFTMPAYAVTVSVTFKVASAPAPAPGGGTTPSPTGAPVIVDGKTQNIGTEKKAGDTTTVTVDQSKLGTNIGGAAVGSSVVVPVSENGSATASLVVKNIEDMAAKSMTLTVQTGNVAYNLNTSAIDTAALVAAFPGADMSTVPFDVTITNSFVTIEGETLVLPPVAFTVTATYGGKAVDVDTFSAYIDRIIEVTKEQAAKITTAVVVSADGSVRHVPTNVIEKDGKYYAVVSSRTNSTYALIQNEVTFADAAGKWYEAAVNEMGSRKIIAGRGADLFDCEAGITRAEFSAILVRALGLPADGASTFSDVPAGEWYAGAVATAAQYGIVAGKGGNRFEPDAAITRQEAMLMLQRAAALTKFTGASSTLDSFADANSVGSWVRDAAKWSVGSGLIQGSDGKLNPTANITRAESATIILRLLQKAGLVDVRSEA